MANGMHVPAWIALFLGIYALAAALGEFRSPGGWTVMLREIERSLALRYVLGVVCITLGAAIYLVSPWNPADWLAVTVTIVGGLCVLEGAAILAIGDRYLAFARFLLERGNRLWASVSALFGVGAIAAGLMRF